MDVSLIPVEEIRLSVRSSNALRRAGIETVGQLLKCPEESLADIKNLGRKSIDEILLKKEEYLRLSKETAQDDLKDDFEHWLSDQDNQNAVREYLKEKNIRLEYLSTLTLDAYNALLFAGIEFLYEVVFLNNEQLMKIHGMVPALAEETAKTVNGFIRLHRDDIRAHCQLNSVPKAESISETGFPPASDMIRIPEYHSLIISVIKKHNHPVEELSLPYRAKNQLLRSGFYTVSDIIFLDRKQLSDIKNIGDGTIDKIIEWREQYLKAIEPELKRIATGEDVSSFYTDEIIRENILSLYQGDRLFGGYSLKEMEEALDLSENVTETQIKKVIGKLLAEKELEYVDFRCYRIYPRFTDYVMECSIIDERKRDMILRRISGETLEMIAKTYDIQRERVRQIVAKSKKQVFDHFKANGSQAFDEDYYLYFYQTYYIKKNDAVKWLGIPESAIGYFDLYDIKQGSRSLESASEDIKGLETGLRLKIKNYLNRDKLFIDGRWIEKKRYALEDLVLKKYCQNDVSFEEFSRIYNRFLEDMEIPYDEDMYYTDAVIRTRINRLAESKKVLWKQNEKLRYYDIDGRDYSELLDTLHIDAYENIELSTLKFLNDYPELMKQYDIRDQYELHNLLKKIISEGSFHDLKFKRMPQIVFGKADRSAAVFELMVENAPITAKELEELARSEYGYDYSVFMMATQFFSEYCHNGVYSVDNKQMSEEHLTALHNVLTDEFYYIEEIKDKYKSLFPDGDILEINSYNLKRMGFNVLSKYVLQHYDSLNQYFNHLLLEPDMVDVTGYRSRFTYVQMLSQCIIENQRRLQIIEYEPNKFINFRVLEREGITLEMIHDFCSEIYDSVEDGSYFTIHSLDETGVLPQYKLLDELGFSEWFYSNILLSDRRFSHQKMFGNIVFYKGNIDITIRSLVLHLIHNYGCVDILDLMKDLKEHFGCVVADKSDILYKIQDTEVYYDNILERIYANKDIYYDELEKEGW